MKANNVIINGFKDVVIQEEELDENSINAGECLIETSLSVISAATELSRYYSLKKGATYPVRPGYCSVGTILAKGSNVKHVEVGDRVMFSGPHSSLQIYDCAKSDGGILYKLKPETSDEAGAFLMMAWIAMNGILPADVKFGDKVVVLGLGSLGLLVSVIYQYMGFDVIAADPVEHRCELAKTMGIKQVLSCKPEEQVAKITALTNEKGADIVVDASGLSSVIETATLVAGKYGQVILMGTPREEYVTNSTIMLNAIHMKMLTVIGSLNRRYTYDNTSTSRVTMKRSMEYLEDLLNNKIIDVDKFISHHVKPQQIGEAYTGLMENKEAYLTVVIDWK